MQKIADAGLLIAVLDGGDQHHKWAAQIFRRESPPFYTADVLIGEAAAVLRSSDALLHMLETGDLVLALDLAQEASALRTMVQKYRDQPMDLGDACCVRMAELLEGSVVYSVDRKDFGVYRKHGRQPIPCRFPD